MNSDYYLLFRLNNVVVAKKKKSSIICLEPQGQFFFLVEIDCD